MAVVDHFENQGLINSVFFAKKCSTNVTEWFLSSTVKETLYNNKNKGWLENLHTTWNLLIILMELFMKKLVLVFFVVFAGNANAFINESFLKIPEGYLDFQRKKEIALAVVDKNKDFDGYLKKFAWSSQAIIYDNLSSYSRGVIQGFIAANYFDANNFSHTCFIKDVVSDELARKKGFHGMSDYLINHIELDVKKRGYLYSFIQKNPKKPLASLLKYAIDFHDCKGVK